MLFVVASHLSPSDLALLGNNIRPGRHGRRRTHGEREDRGVLRAVNRPLASLHERIDCLHPAVIEPRSLAS